MRAVCSKRDARLKEGAPGEVQCNLSLIFFLHSRRVDVRM